MSMSACGEAFRDWQGRAAMLRELAVGCVREREPLARHTTWNIGGPAAVLIEPDSVDSLGRVLRLARRAGWRCLVLGGGSNVLCPDEGVGAVVVKIGRAMSRATFDGPRIEVQAGLALWRLAHRAMTRGLTGLEHTVGIPGHLGGLVAMNGGSLRRTIGQNLTEVVAFTPAGERVTLQPGECELAHRRSRFQRSGEIVAAVRLRLEPGDPGAIRRSMIEIIRERRSKFPLRWPNCGSVFFSTSEIYDRLGPPGWIIEQAGCKGLHVGGAMVSEQHANFIVNTGGATAADVLELMRRVRRAVAETFDVTLPHEVRLIDTLGRSCRLTDDRLEPLGRPGQSETGCDAGGRCGSGS